MSDLSRGIGFRAATLPERAPTIPDWSVVTQPRARAALKDVYAAANWDRRGEALDLGSARILAALLRQYAEFGRPPSRTELAAAVGLTESSVIGCLERLARHDLILLDRTTGTIQGAYPFTQATTGHSITLITTNRTIATMCAIDALGAGAMCREDVTIRSACSFCAAPIEGHTFARGIALGGIAPVGAVVWAGLRESSGCAADTLCGELLFFCSEAHLDGWRAGRPGAGYRLSPAEAFEVGKALFIDRAMMNETLGDEEAKVLS